MMKENTVPVRKVTSDYGSVMPLPLHLFKKIM